MYVAIVHGVHTSDKATVNTTVTNNIVYVNVDPRTLIKEVFGNEATLAIAIAMAESHMRPDRIGDTHLTYTGKDGQMYGDSIGLFQIRTFPDRPHREMLKDAYFNIRYAKIIRDKQGFRAWSVYNNGSYRKFLPVLKPINLKKEV